MAAHGHYGDTSDIRWVAAEGEWYRRCPDCRKREQQCFWPLTREFWNPQSMQRCRACNLVRKRVMDRAARAARPNARLEAQRKYSRENRAVINLKRRERRRLANARSNAA